LLLDAPIVPNVLDLPPRHAGELIDWRSEEANSNADYKVFQTNSKLMHINISFSYSF
jgi:hypothetical protein